MMLSAYATLRTSCKEAHLSFLGWSINGLLLHSWMQNKMLMMQSNPHYRVPACARSLARRFSQRSVILAGTGAVHYRVPYFLGTFSWIDVSQRWLCCYRMYRAMYLCTVARAGAQQSYPCPWTEASGARSLPADGVQALYSPPTSLLTDNTHLEQITQQHLQMISPMRPCNGLPLQKARHAAERRRPNSNLMHPKRWSKRPSWRSAYSLLAHLPAAVSATSAVLSPHRLSGRFAAPASA